MPKHVHHKVWLNGKVLPPEEGTISIFTQAVFRGANVYEGIRAYWNEDEKNLFVWKLDPHLKRFFQSMKIMRMKSPYTPEEYRQGVLDFIRENGFREDVHFRLVAYLGDGGAGGMQAFQPEDIEVGAFIAGGPRPMGPFLKEGLRACVSSWRRISDETTPPRVKAGANYQNNRLAAMEAKVNGYDDAIMLNKEGKVAEATGASLFLIREGVPITPPVTSGILESVTRKALLGMFEKHLDRAPVEREVDRTELYVAEEILICGSAWEVTPVVSVDKIEVGEGTPGPITRQIQDIFFSAARGYDESYEKDLTPAY